MAFPLQIFRNREISVYITFFLNKFKWCLLILKHLCLFSMRFIISNIFSTFLSFFIRYKILLICRLLTFFFILLYLPLISHWFLNMPIWDEIASFWRFDWFTEYLEVAHYFINFILQFFFFFYFLELFSPFTYLLCGHYLLTFTIRHIS